MLGTPAHLKLLIAKNCSDSPRTQIPGRVYGVAAIVSEAHSNVEDNEADVERDDPLGDGHVARVCDGAHAEQE